MVLLGGNLRRRAVMIVSSEMMACISVRALFTAVIPCTCCGSRQSCCPGSWTFVRRLCTRGRDLEYFWYHWSLFERDEGLSLYPTLSWFVVCTVQFSNEECGIAPLLQPSCDSRFRRTGAALPFIERGIEISPMRRLLLNRRGGRRGTQGTPWPISLWTASICRKPIYPWRKRQLGTFYGYWWRPELRLHPSKQSPLWARDWRRSIVVKRRRGNGNDSYDILGRLKRCWQCFVRSFRRIR